MILVSNHTFTPPHRDPICIQPALPASTFSSLHQQQQQRGVRDSSLKPGPPLFTDLNIFMLQSAIAAAPFISSPSISVNLAAGILKQLKCVCTHCCFLYTDLNSDRELIGIFHHLEVKRKFCHALPLWQNHVQLFLITTCMVFFFLLSCSFI